jgi:hypothetical protein
MAIDQAQKHIRNAWIGAAILASVIVMYSLLVALGKASNSASALSNFSAGAVIGALAFGIRRSSRVCAVLMFALVALTFAAQWVMARRLDGIIVGAVFLYCFAQGIRGTLWYHRLKAHDHTNN